VVGHPLSRYSKIKRPMEIEQSLLPEIIGLIVLVILSGFFSGAEAALLSLRSHRIKSISDESPRRKALFKLWLMHPNQILTTILIGNNLVNISASAISVRVADTLIGNMALAYAIGVMTFVILFFGEIVPKVFAKNNAESFSIFSLRILRSLHWILRPIVIPLTTMTRRLIEVSGGKVVRTGPMITEQDFLHYLDLAQRSGALDREEGEMISSALKFNEKLVKDILIPRNEVTIVAADIPFEELVDLIHRVKHSRYPVFFQNVDHIIGVIHAKDVLSASKDAKAFSIYRFIRQPYFVNEYRNIDKVFQEMKARKMHLAVVKDENNQFSGIVTMEDIIEELVGEISDEHDVDVSMVQMSEHFVEVSGKTSILELEKTINVELPKSPAYANLNGFLLYLTGGELPQESTRLIFGQLEFIILKTDGRSFIETIRVKKHHYNFELPESQKK